MSEQMIENENTVKRKEIETGSELPDEEHAAKRQKTLPNEDQALDASAAETPTAAQKEPQQQEEAQQQEEPPQQEEVQQKIEQETPQEEQQKDQKDEQQPLPQQAPQQAPQPLPLPIPQQIAQQQQPQQQQPQQQQPQQQQQHSPLQQPPLQPPSPQTLPQQVAQPYQQIQQASNNGHPEARAEVFQQFQQALQDSAPKVFKLFVGQIPFSFNEENLTQIFSTFGNVLEAAAIRDRMTGKHKGCAFVSFTRQEEADLAIETLHNKMTIPGMNRPMQVKYAESDKSSVTMMLLKRQQQLQQGATGVAAAASFNPSMAFPKGEAIILPEQENKLFVGMVPKTVTELQLRSIFEPFGRIIDFAYIRGAQAKNCAFVRYETLQEALRAIEGVHEKCYLEGASQALVVRFADKESSRKRMTPFYHVAQQEAAIPFQSQQFGTPISVWYPHPHAISGSQQVVASPSHSQATHPFQFQMQQSMQQQQPPIIPGSTPTAADYLATPPRLNIVSAPAVRYTTPVISAAPVYATQSPLVASTQNRLWGSPAIPFQRAAPRRDGPANCNLFIYHLPPFYSDTDLANLFAPFGNVLSATVFMDKASQTSKCFGFVSYDNPQSALAAIQQMNGFQIAHKRLKVQLKKEK